MSQVAGQLERIYDAAESFDDAPGTLHPISRNASETGPAKLLAIFVVNPDHKVLPT